MLPLKASCPASPIQTAHLLFNSGNRPEEMSTAAKFRRVGRSEIDVRFESFSNENWPVALKLVAGVCRFIA